MAFIFCFLCAVKLDKRTDKNGKPYFVCNPCGIQLFIRREHGIKLLETLLRDCEKNEIPFRQRAHHIFQIQALLTEIDGTKKQIDRVKLQAGHIFRDENKVRAYKLLEIKLESLFAELRQLAQ